MMVLAAFGMLIPAIFYSLPEVLRVAREEGQERRLFLEHERSVGVCVILMLTYILYLVFSLKTHQNLFNPDPAETRGDEGLHGHGHAWGMGRSIGTLLVATTFVAIMSEVPSLKPAHRNEILAVSRSHSLGFEEILSQGIRDGSIADCDVRMTGNAIMGAINWIPKWFHGDAAMARQVLESFPDVLTRGLRKVSG